MSRLRVIGLGNAMAGDDAVGLFAARRLRRQLPADIEIVECQQPDAAMLAGLGRDDAIICIDAVKGGGEPGSIHRLHLSDLDGPEPSPCSSHGLGLAHWLALMQALGEGPSHIEIIGISIAETKPDAAMSPAVQRALADAVRCVCACIEEFKRLHQAQHA